MGRKVYKKVEASIDAVNKKQAELGADFVGEKTSEIEAGVEKLIEAGFKEGSEPRQKLKGYLKEIRDEISKGFTTNNSVQTKVGVTASAPQGLPTLSLPAQIVSLNTGPAQAAVSALRDLQLSATEEINRARQSASEAELARIEQEKRHGRPRRPQRLTPLWTLQTDWLH
jgi:hypothetical protein